MPDNDENAADGSEVILSRWREFIEPEKRDAVDRFSYYLYGDRPSLIVKMVIMNILLLIYTLLINHQLCFLQDAKVVFNGSDPDNWELIDYEGHGPVSINDSCIIIGRGEYISGIRWKKDFPRSDYEVTFSAKRTSGNDFFCGMTFPVKDAFVTLVLGGWGGTMCGLSCIDGYDAANNQTGTIFYFGKDTWWPVRLRVSEKKIEAWVQGDKLIDFTIGGSSLSLRMEVESSVPFGITTYKTTGVIRDLRLHLISE